MVRAPVWIVPGHADRSITVALGYGRDSAGRVGGTSTHRVGFNAYLLRTSERPWFAPGLAVRKTGDTALVACTQQHHLMENRDLVRAADVGQYRQTPRFASQLDEERIRAQTGRGVRRPLTLYEPHAYPNHKWGMVIDLTTCTGCRAHDTVCTCRGEVLHCPERTRPHFPPKS